MGTARRVLDAKSGDALHSFLDLAARDPKYYGLRTARPTARLVTRMSDGQQFAHKVALVTGISRRQSIGAHDGFFS